MKRYEYDELNALLAERDEWKASAEKAEAEVASLRGQVATLKLKLESADKAIGEEINNRDQWEDKATSLAEAVAKFLGDDVGEHSSANCPIKTALRLLDEADAPAALREDKARLDWIFQVGEYVVRDVVWGPRIIAGRDAIDTARAAYPESDNRSEGSAL